MATIEVNGNPSAYGDRNRGYHDDEAPTMVTVTTVVTNTGTADGRVRLRLGVLRPGQEEVTRWEPAPASTGYRTIPYRPDAPNYVDFTVTYQVPDDQVEILVAELNSEDGSFFAEESLTVNSFITPTNPNLQASQIRFTVR